MRFYGNLKTIYIDSSNYRIFGFTFLVLGLLSLLATLFSLITANHKLKVYTQTDGTVIENQSCSIEDQSKKRAIITFLTTSGENITFSSVCSHPPRYRINQIVKVIYPVDNPDNALVKDNREIFFLVFFNGIFAFVFLQLSLYILVIRSSAPIIGMPAAIYIGVNFFIFGLFIIFLSSRYWFNDMKGTYIGISIIIFSILVVAYEKIKLLSRKL